MSDLWGPQVPVSDHEETGTFPSSKSINPDESFPHPVQLKDLVYRPSSPTCSGVCLVCVEGPTVQSSYFSVSIVDGECITVEGGCDKTRLVP